MHLHYRESSLFRSSAIGTRVLFFGSHSCLPVYGYIWCAGVLGRTNRTGERLEENLISTILKLDSIKENS